MSDKTRTSSGSKHPAGPKTRGRPARDSSLALTRPKIVKAALQIVDRDGLAALSMRRLGALLGVDPMAIYHHLPNKAALYDAIVEAVMAEIDMGPSTAGDSGQEPAPGAAPEEQPAEQLRQAARSYLDALLAHPNALPVVATRPARTPASLRPIEGMRAVIARLGLAAQEAAAVVEVCRHYITGWAQTSAESAQGPELREEFERGLNVIFSGLPAAEESRPAPGRGRAVQPAPWEPDAD